MTEKAIEARRAYKRQWAKDNPDKIKAQQERYWNKKAAAAEDIEQTESPSESEPAAEGE